MNSQIADFDDTDNVLLAFHNFYSVVSKLIVRYPVSVEMHFMSRPHLLVFSSITNVILIIRVSLVIRSWRIRSINGSFDIKGSFNLQT